MDMAARRKKLRFRAEHRGMQEADRLIGRFADAHLAAMEADELERFELFLAEADQDLLDWYFRRRPLPDDLKDDPLMARFLAFAFEPGAR